MLSKFNEQWDGVVQRSNDTNDTVAKVKAATDTIASNHLAHLNDKQDKVIEILTSVDRNIAVLVDRTK